MISFSVNSSNVSNDFSVKVWNLINSNLGYFKKFNGKDWEEAVHRTYFHVLAKNDKSYNSMLPYIKKLARTILRVKNREFSNDLVTEKGDISPVFATLRDYIDTTNLDGDKELISTFKELYLLDDKAFMGLQTIFEYNDVADIENVRNVRIRNEHLRKEMHRLVEKHGADYLFRALNKFFYDLPKLTTIRKTGFTKDVVLKKGNFDIIDKIPDTPTIKGKKDGKHHFIDKTRLSMDKNPDYFEWDIIGTSMCDILKIDLNPFMSYIYEETFVDEGVSTRHIDWCGEKYRLTTPGGTVYVGVDKDKFINYARIELILNLMTSNVGAVLAISPDNLYVKPTKAFTFDRIRLKFQTGKVLDLPITTYKRR